MYICIYQIIPEKGFEINATMEPTNLQQTIFFKYLHLRASCLCLEGSENLHLHGKYREGGLGKWDTFIHIRGNYPEKFLISCF